MEGFMETGGRYAVLTGFRRDRSFGNTMGRARAPMIGGPTGPQSSPTSIEADE